MSWVVANGQHTAYRSMHQGVPIWVADAGEALQFARRRDAELFAAEDEDAWAILELPYDIAAAHAKLAQMAALVVEWRDEYNKQWIGTTRVDVRSHAARCDCTHCVTERALSDPDAARAGRLWEKLWAEHAAVERFKANSHDDVWGHLLDVHAAVEAERGGA